MTVMTTWTSLRRPLTNVGRSGRSISRQVRMASSDGRPSRRKNEPGIFPIGVHPLLDVDRQREEVELVLGRLAGGGGADSSMVSSSRYAATDPAAWRARRPVSNRMVRVPNDPLSMTACVLKIWGPSTGASCFC
jgi:hypothetical protein